MTGPTADFADAADFVDVADPSVDASAAVATVFTCALCGGRFTHGGQACGACPLASGCGLVRCPHCGYQFPRSSRLVDWFLRRIGAGRSPRRQRRST